MFAGDRRASSRRKDAIVVVIGGDSGGMKRSLAYGRSCSNLGRAMRLATGGGKPLVRDECPRIN